MKTLLFFLLLPCFTSGQNPSEKKSNADKANAFIISLTTAQKEKALFPFEDMNRYEWHYVPVSMLPRKGISMKDLSPAQKEKLGDLLQAFLSKEGYNKTKQIMDLEYVLQELEPNNPHRIAENYILAIYGQPEKDSVWGWKFTGHHLSLNFTVIKNKIAFAPLFFGANPATVNSGPQKGLRVMKTEEDLGFGLVNSLTPAQKSTAIFQVQAFHDIVTTNSLQVTPLKTAGIIAGKMTNMQKQLLVKLVLAYLLPLPSEIAIARMKKITAEDVNQICFGWAGGTQQGEPHYYRVQGKTFLIEFDNTQNNANHIHAVWRDFNGDFGQDLLKEHYQQSNHHH